MPREASLSRTAQAQFRQRGFDDAYYGRDERNGRELAERVGEQALAAYNSGATCGRREKERDAAPA